MTNIAIVGKMYAGKTTLANAIVAQGEHSRVMMAGPLKALGHLWFGEPINKGESYWTSYGYKSGRQILQEIGQSMKIVDRDFWIRCFQNDVDNMFDNGQAYKFVVDDVRFQFEAEYLKEHGWTLVKVDTPEETRLARGKAALGRSISTEELGHESEREVDLIKPDYIWSGVTPLDEYDDRVVGLIQVLDELQAFSNA